MFTKLQYTDGKEELDPAVYQAAVTYFNFSAPASSTIHLMDGATYIHELARSAPKWDFVIHDCFTGGQIPVHLFSKEFWTDLAGLMEEDGIVAVVSRFEAFIVQSDERERISGSCRGVRRQGPYW